MAIDLRTDTITKPSGEMRQVMYQAEVGDDAYQEDLQVSALEEYCAEFFGKEAAVFMPSGTMSNQIALRCHTRPGDEVILDRSYHINFYESAATSDLAKVAINSHASADGVLRVRDVEEMLDSKYRSPIYAKAKLICVENTIGGHAGKVFPFDELLELHRYAQEQGMAIHMDGARITNAIVASGVTAKQYGSVCDTISACFAKGLAAPFGSILAGSREVIEAARMYRKWYGGTMHQSGMLAAAALYALQNNIGRLAEDHEHAKLLAESLADAPGLDVDPNLVETNMIFLNVSELGVSGAEFVELAAQEGVLLFPQGAHVVRAVTHVHISRDQIVEAARIIRRVCQQLKGVGVLHVV